MKQKLLLTKSLRAALLMLGVVLLTFVKVNALTINVHADYPPYVYAWNGETEYLGKWPGQQVTDIITQNGVNYYSVEIAADNVSFILNNNLGGQTGTMTANGDKYLDYDSSTSCTEALPGCAVTKSDYFVYFANAVPDSWTGETMYAHIYNDSGNTLTWKSNDEIMTYVGTNGYGNKVYLWNSTLNFTPTKIIFTDGSNETNAAEWTNGGYYNNYNNGANGKQDAILLTVVPNTRTGVLLTSDNFSDANFRAALSEITGVAEGQTLNVSTINTLHIENRGINTLNGINYFSNLEELYAQNNSTTATTDFIDVTSNTKLRILNVSGNTKLQYVKGIAKATALEELYMSNVDFWPSKQISTSTTNDKLSASHTKLKVLTLNTAGLKTSFAMPMFPALEYLDMSNNSSFDGFSNTTGSVKLRLPNLKTLKLSNVNLPLADSTIVKNLVASGNTALEYLDISHNTKLVRVNLYKCPNLKYLNVDSCKLTWLDLANNINLETAIVRNNNFTQTVNYSSTSNFPSTYSSSKTYLYIKGLSKLKYLDASKCAFTSFGGNAGSDQLSALTSLDTLILNGNTSTTFYNANVENLSALKYLDLSNCTGIIMNSNYQFKSLTPTNNPNLETLLIPNIDLKNPDPFDGFTKLKLLDVSRNTSLAKIEIKNCTALEEVIFTNSGASTLKTLTFSNNGYTSAQDMPTLTGLSASGATLDLSNNLFTSAPNLANVTVNKLILDNNRLTSISNLSSLSSLTILSARNNSLVNATLNNTNITSIDLGANTLLKTADLSNNKLETIAFEGCTALENLNLSYNNIVTFGKAGSSPVNSMNGLTSLKTLNLANNGIYSITEDKTQHSSLQDLTGLESVDLSNNTKNSDGTFHLLQVSGLSNLATINLTGDAMDQIEVKNCALTDINFGTTNGISDFSALSKLDVTGNKLVNVTVPRTPNTLLSIDMSNNALLQSVTANHDVDGSNSKLRYIEVDGCPLLTNFTMTGCDLYYATQANTLNATNNPALATLNLSDDAIASADITLNGYQNLTSVDLSDNTIWAHGLTITNCPALTTIDVENNPAMTKVEANNGEYSNSSYPLVKTTSGMNLSLYFNQNNFSAIPTVTAGVKYLYLQENAFAENLSLDGDAISLKGIALSNKSSVLPIKTFTASVASPTLDEWRIDFTKTPPAIVRSNDAASDGSNMVLEAINLSGNNSLEEIHVNGFKAITKLASGNDMTTDDGKGLYVSGLGALKKLDISNNRIETLGENGSLSGLSGLEELNASHNKIRTLTNKTALNSKRDANGNGMYTSTTTPNIEDLTGLKKLNLSHNLIGDSIHLWKNTALEWLDVSNNRIISKRAVGDKLYYLNTKTGVMTQWHESTYTVQCDPYTGDTNDTIGLRMLDLYFQPNLKYLDISSTNIRNTASSHFYMANFVDPSTLHTQTTSDNQGHKVGRNGVPHFVLVSHLPALEELHVNYNGMQSLGIGSAAGYYNNAHDKHQDTWSSTYCNEVTGCPNLKFVEAKEMNGMHPNIMKGEIRISANNKKIEHYDVSGGGWDYVGAADGADLSHLRYINVSGNYNSNNSYTYHVDKDGNETWTTTYTDRNGGTHSYTVHGNPFVLNVEGFPALDSVIVENTPHLTEVNASHTPALEVISVAQNQLSNDLIKLYVNHAPKLDEVDGLETLNNLQVYHANDSHFTGDFVMPAAATATLRDLRVSNEALSYAASRNNLTSVPLGSFNALERVDVQNNPAIAALDINATSAAKLAHLDFANCHLDNNGFTGSDVEDLTALEYLDCSNDNTNAPNGTVGNWLTDLNLTAAKGLTTLKAANNELYMLAVSPSQTMDVLDFHNNHVNGINLTGVTVTTYNCDNNGRKVNANAKAMAGGKTLYYFQLDANAAGPTKGGKFVEDAQSDMYLHNGLPRTLGLDGFEATKASFASTVTHTSSSGAPRLKDAATAADLDPSKIYGTIAVLEPTSTSDYSRASYDYNEGNDNLTTKFYLDWKASDAIFTAIDDINGNVGEVNLRPGVGGMEVVGPAGQTFGVYDMAGRLVQQVTTDQTGHATIDGLTPGIYVVAGEKAQVR